MPSRGECMSEGMLSQVRKFEEKQKKFLESQMLASIYNNIVSGVLMTGLLLYIGVKPSMTGVFLSIPLLANVFQIAMGRMWNYFQNYKEAMNRLILIARLGIISIVFVPLLFGNNTVKLKVVITAGILICSYTLASSAGVHFNFWMVNSIPVEKQGTFFAFRDRVVVGGAMLISFGAAYIIDDLKRIHKEYIGFFAAFSVAAILAFADYAVLKKIPEQKKKKQKEKIKWSIYWKILKEDRQFWGFILYMLFLSLSLNLANPYYNSYMLNELNLKYIHVIYLTGIQICMQIAVSSIWGKIANRIRWSRILNVTVLILAIQFFVWAMVTKESLGLIYIIFISSGVISTGLVTGQFMVPYEFVKKSNVMAYLSLCTSVTALGGFAGSVIGSKIISAFEGITYRFWKLEIGAMQINMMISGIALLGTVVYASIVLKDTERSYYVRK